MAYDSYYDNNDNADDNDNENEHGQDDYAIYDYEDTDDVKDDEETAAGNWTQDEDVVKYKLISPGLKHHKELMKLLGKVDRYSVPNIVVNTVYLFNFQTVKYITVE